MGRSKKKKNRSLDRKKQKLERQRSKRRRSNRHSNKLDKVMFEFNKDCLHLIENGFYLEIERTSNEEYMIAARTEDHALVKHYLIGGDRRMADEIGQEIAQTYGILFHPWQPDDASRAIREAEKCENTARIDWPRFYSTMKNFKKRR